MHQAVLKFWFEDTDPRQWWISDSKFDALIRDTYGELLERASLAELYAWRATPKGRLAEIIVLDQFSRNVFRNTSRAFAQDSMALALAQEAIALNAHLDLSPTERAFMLLPYMHSESKQIHIEAEKLFKAFAPKDNYDFELKHKAIVDRFGRYPHRNGILGRASTQEELEFLKQPGSSF